MWLWAERPPQRPQPHEVNQTQLFGPLFHQEASHMTRCGGNMYELHHGLKVGCACPCRVLDGWALLGPTL
jgi:hypothetical protein